MLKDEDDLIKIETFAKKKTFKILDERQTKKYGIRVEWCFHIIKKYILPPHEPNNMSMLLVTQVYIFGAIE